MTRSTAQPSESQRSDASLLRAVAGSDEAAVAALFHDHVDSVYRYVYRRVGEQREDAEEVTQDTFVTAISLAATYNGSCGVLTWLCGIAKLRIADFLRRQGRNKRIPADRIDSLDDESLRALHDFRAGSALDETLDRLDATRLVDAMMSALTDDEHEALMLRYVEQFSLREIAAHLNRSEKAIEALLDRAKKKAAQAGAAWM